MGRVVVLGSINMDLVATVPRLPAPGETVIGTTLVQFPGGKGANQAVAAARLGANVTLVGRVGADVYGSALLDHLRKEPIAELAVAQDQENPTGVAIVQVDSSGENTVTVVPGSNWAVAEADVARATSNLGADAILLLQLEIPPDAVRSAVEQARSRGARAVLNAAPATHMHSSLLSDLDVCIVNETEASSAIGRPVASVGDALVAADELHGLGIPLAIVTLGSQGAVYAAGGGAQHVPPFTVPVIDTTGAGDAFVGALCAALVWGSEPAEAVRLANAAGAAATTRQGAQSAFPNPADLKMLVGLEWPGAAAA